VGNYSPTSSHEEVYVGRVRIEGFMGIFAYLGENHSCISSIRYNRDIRQSQAAEEEYRSALIRLEVKKGNKGEKEIAQAVPDSFVQTLHYFVCYPLEIAAGGHTL
jgi:hypothetical protein